VRLVRAVADLPNIIYVLCYSRKILARSLSKIMALENDGDAFIEKIVQVEFSIPRPEEFDLRRMLRERIEHLIPEIISNVNEPPNSGSMARLSYVIDTEGRRSIQTPRHVSRIINSLQLYGLPVLDHIDIGDLLWLQILRLTEIDLYKWVERYIVGAVAIANGARPSMGEESELLIDLERIIGSSGRDPEITMRELREYLPGIVYNSETRAIPILGNHSIYHELAGNRLDRYLAERRLASPQHYRYYFALSRPKDTVGDEQYEDFRRMLGENCDEAISLFDSLIEERRSQGGVLAELLLGRLQGGELDTLEDNALAGLAIVISNTMDSLALATGEGDWGRYWPWTTANRAFDAVFRNLQGALRATAIGQSFGEGASLGWLSDYFRRLTFAHGRYGERPIQVEERIYSEEEYDEIDYTLIGRFRAMDLATFASCPNALSVLYAWHQSAIPDDGEVSDWIRGHTEQDGDFLTFLERCRTWSVVNGEVIYPLRRGNLEGLLDVDDARSRVSRLVESPDADFANRALRLRHAFELDEEF